MQALSVSIITYNEEKNIARCLDSVKDIANEIVVLDSFSTDKTESICRQYGVKFHQQSFLGYLEQKQLAEDYCKHYYILSLDADECLSPELIQSIKEAKKNDFSSDGYSMNRLSNFCGKWIKHGTWYPDRKLRLYNKQKGKWSGLTIHEHIEMQAGSKLSLLKGDIHHYSYYTVEEVLTQQNKFTSIQAKAMLAKGKTSSWFKLIVNPFVAFINGFIFKLGFLDGADGFFIASTVAYNTMVKYYKLLMLQKK